MRADARAHREDILNAARKVFLSEGINVSLRTIARKAGVGIATLLRHFPNRIELISAIQHQNIEDIKGIIQQAIETWDQDPDAAWNRVIDDLVALGMNGGLGILITEVHMNPELSSNPDFMKARAEVFACVEPALHHAIEAGYLPPDIDVIQFFMGLMVVSRPLGSGANALAPGFDQWIVKTYLAGLKTPRIQTPERTEKGQTNHITNHI